MIRKKGILENVFERKVGTEMIEIIYNDNHKEEKTTGFPVKLPRNFRQIGSGDDFHKIYIEDYVMTYIHKLWEKEGQEYQAGVLMGNCKKYGGETYIFISGAVRAGEMEQEGSGLKFTDKIWADLYEDIRQYFNSLEIVGWFYARNDSAKEIDAGLFKTHVDNFGGVDKVLFLIDKNEKEEDFYAYENGQLVALSGYYVYYEKNEQMQEYMVEHIPHESVDEDNDDRVTTNYRLLVQEKQDNHAKKKLSSTLYTACTCLVIAVLAVGTILLRDYDRVQQLESQMQQLAVSVLKPNTETIEVEQVEGNVYPTQTESSDQNKEPDLSINESETKTISQTTVSSEMPTEETTPEVTKTETSKAKESEETQTVVQTTEYTGAEMVQTEAETTTSEVQDVGKAGYYHTVKKGETLTSICMEIYHTDHMVSTVKEVNGIEDGDKIYPGQEIYLP